MLSMLDLLQRVFERAAQPLAVIKGSCTIIEGLLSLLLPLRFRSFNFVLLARAFAKAITTSSSMWLPLRLLPEKLRSSSSNKELGFDKDLAKSIHPILVISLSERFNLFRVLLLANPLARATPPLVLNVILFEIKLLYFWCLILKQVSQCDSPFITCTIDSKEAQGDVSYIAMQSERINELRCRLIIHSALAMKSETPQRFFIASQ